LQAALRSSRRIEEAVILRDLQEMEYREIAEVLGIPEGTVKSRINRGGPNWPGSCEGRSWRMNCADVEILICDYLDGTLATERKSAVERHLAQCPACAELARDSAAAVEFMERAADVEPPPELITRILFDAPWSKGRNQAERRASWMAGILSPILEPRFAMGMAMTVLSLALLARFVAPVRQLRMSDLEPAEVWAGLRTAPTGLGAHGKVLRQLSSFIRFKPRCGMAAAGRRYAVRSRSGGSRTENGRA